MSLGGSMSNQDEIQQIQAYILKKINNLRYGYTTLNQLDQIDMLINLIANWIEFEMEKESICIKGTSIN